MLRRRAIWAVLLVLVAACDRPLEPAASSATVPSTTLRSATLPSATVPSTTASAAAPRTNEQRFWDWFVANDARLLALDATKVKEREAMFDEIAAELQKVGADLTFEIGPRSSDGKRDFVISAGGIVSAFPRVKALTAAAPAMAHWNIVEFRPRRYPVSAVAIDDVKLDPKRVFYELSPQGEKLAIVVCIAGMVESSVVFKQAGYVLLDEALGEYDVETKVGGIAFMAQGEGRCEKKLTIGELAADFDERYARLRR
jgi:hypothetical protein